MRRLKGHLVGIDQGSGMLFSDFEDGGVMWTGDGPREMKKRIRFAEAFALPPVVHVSMSMWDMDQKTNQRADISTSGITAKGFNIVFRTWGDTRVARVRADWMAIGEVVDDDDWDVV
jgi:hypothetical protein